MGVFGWSSTLEDQRICVPACYVCAFPARYFWRTTRETLYNSTSKLPRDMLLYMYVTAQGLSMIRYSGARDKAQAEHRVSVQSGSIKYTSPCPIAAASGPIFVTSEKLSRDKRDYPAPGGTHPVDPVIRGKLGRHICSEAPGGI